MSNYVYQRTGGPLVYWTPGAPPRGYRAGETRSLGQEPPAPGENFGLAGPCAGGGGCGCSSCGGGPKGGMGGGYPEYGARGPRAIAVPSGQAVRYGMSGANVPTVFTPISQPIGGARRYVSSLGTVPFIPGAPEPLTGVSPDDVTGLINPYPTSSFPWAKVIFGGLALAVAYPHLKKLLKKK